MTRIATTSRGPRRARSLVSVWAGCLVACLAQLPAQDLVYATAEGSGRQSGGSACAALPDGSVLVSGSYSQTATFGVGQANETTLTTALNSGAYVASYAPDGTLNWARNVGSLRPNDGWWAALYVEDMKANADGSYFVSGHMRNVVRFGAGTAAEVDVFGNNNLFIAAYNADGSLRYAKSGGGYALVTDHVLGLALDGSAYVAGRYYSYRRSTPVPFGDGVTIPASVRHNYDMFLVRYKPDGTTDWGVRMTNGSTNVPRAIEPLTDGSIAFAGNFYRPGTLHIGNSAVPLATVPNFGRYDIALVRFAVSGSVIWAKGIGGSNWDYGASISRTSDGGFYLAGVSRHQVTIARGESNEITYTAPDNSSDSRVWLARYDRDGKLLRFRPTLVNAEFMRTRVATTPSGGAALVSPFFGSVVFGSGTAEQTTLTDSDFTRDHFLAVYGSDLAFRWARGMRRGASGFFFGTSYGPDVTASPDGSLTVTGDFMSQMHFNAGLSDAATISANPSSGASNTYVARFLDGDALTINIPEDIAQICDSGTQHATVNFVVEIIGTPPAGSRLVVTNTTNNAVLLDKAASSGPHGVGPLQLGLGAYTIKVQILDGTKELLVETFEISIEDNTPPQLFGCTNKTIECAGATTTLYRSLLGIWATDSCDSNPEITFAPAALTMGTHSVTVTARDDAGNSSSCTIAVTVRDTTPPSFTVIPEDIVRECTGHTGTSVSFDIAATDACGSVTIVCKDQNGRTVNPAGTVFADGEHTVTCTATDSHGNSRKVDFKVSVVDNTAPVIITPADIVVGNDAGECFAKVTFAITATDICDPNVAITTHVGTVSVQSGDAFPVGTSTVTVTARDKAGNDATKQFNITVEDREAPVITAPATKTVVTDCKGSILAIDSSMLGTSATTDNCDGTTQVVVSPSALSPGGAQRHGQQQRRGRQRRDGDRAGHGPQGALRLHGPPSDGPQRRQQDQARPCHPGQGARQLRQRHGVEWLDRDPRQGLRDRR